METKEHLEFEMESRNFLNIFRKNSKVNLLYKFAIGIERNAVGCIFDGLVRLKVRPEVGKLVKRINVANDYK